MATNTARRKSKLNQLDLLPGSVLDESVSSINLPLPSVYVLPESKICKVNYVHLKANYPRYFIFSLTKRPL